MHIIIKAWYNFYISTKVTPEKCGKEQNAAVAGRSVRGKEQNVAVTGALSMR